MSPRYFLKHSRHNIYSAYKWSINFLPVYPGITPLYFRTSISRYYRRYYITVTRVLYSHILSALVCGVIRRLKERREKRRGILLTDDGRASDSFLDFNDYYAVNIFAIHLVRLNDKTKRNDVRSCPTKRGIVCEFRS